MSSLHVAIIGASGGIGSAFVKLLSEDSTNTIHAFSRTDMTNVLPNVHCANIDYADECSLHAAAKITEKFGALDLVIVTTGVLHDNRMTPEKSLRELDKTNLERNFFVNTIGPALAAKAFLPKLRHDKRALFAVLSARVGSISDNRLGGWYAYRASKAALNMLIKTASIEIARRKKYAIVVGLHPGTVATKLSEPFQKNVPSKKLFSTDYSAKQLICVLEGLSSEDSGNVFSWDGCVVPP